MRIWGAFLKGLVKWALSAVYRVEANALEHPEILVGLDGAAVRVREESLRSIVEHVARPLRARVLAVWQGHNRTAAKLARKFKIYATFEDDVKIEDFLTWDVPRVSPELLRTIFYAAYTKYRLFSRIKQFHTDWVVYTRSDMKWLADIPPLSLWQNTETVWIPDLLDWDGVYDRMAILPNRYAKIYLSGPFEALVSPPAVVDVVFEARPTVTSEVLIETLLTKAGAQIGGFPGLGAILCCTNLIPECSNHRQEDQCVNGYRYFHEYVEAAHAAQALADGAQWIQTRGQRDMLPPCGTGVYDEGYCGNERSEEIGLMDSVFYTKRRCCKETPYLSFWKPLPCGSAHHGQLIQGTVLGVYDGVWSIEECCKRCNYEPGCEAWNWYEPDYVVEVTGPCFLLLNAVPPMLQHEGVVSGFPHKVGPNHVSGCNEMLIGRKDIGYKGCQTHTKSGTLCQKWTDQFPHGHDISTVGFPGFGISDHNYCRNPGGMKETIWCLTTDPRVIWDYCEPRKDGRICWSLAQLGDAAFPVMCLPS